MRWCDEIEQHPLNDLLFFDKHHIEFTAPELLCSGMEAVLSIPKKKEVRRTNTDGTEAQKALVP